MENSICPELQRNSRTLPRHSRPESLQSHFFRRGRMKEKSEVRAPARPDPRTKEINFFVLFTF